MVSIKRLFDRIKDMFAKKDRLLDASRSEIQANIDYICGYQKIASQSVEKLINDDKEWEKLRQNGEARYNSARHQEIRDELKRQQEALQKQNAYLEECKSKLASTRPNTNANIRESQYIEEAFACQMTSASDRTDLAILSVPFWNISKFIYDQKENDYVKTHNYEVFPMSNIEGAIKEARIDGYKQNCPSGVMFIMSTDGQSNLQKKLDSKGQMLLDINIMMNPNQIQTILVTNEVKPRIEQILNNAGLHMFCDRIQTYEECGREVSLEPLKQRHIEAFKDFYNLQGYNIQIEGNYVVCPYQETTTSPIVNIPLGFADLDNPDQINIENAHSENLLHYFGDKIPDEIENYLYDQYQIGFGE